jgi:hypothetical protein
VGVSSGFLTLNVEFFHNFAFFGGCIIRMFRELRFGVIFDYTPKLRPFGEKIKDFFLMSLNIGVFSHFSFEVFR